MAEHTSSSASRACGPHQKFGRSARRAAGSCAAGLALLAGLVLGGCRSADPALTEQSARAATTAEDWPLAADLWFQVHRAEEPKTAQPYLETAHALYESGDSESACGMLDQGLERFPHNARMLEARGRLLESCGYQRAAESTYERLVAVEPDGITGLAALGRVRMGLGLERAALEPLERLVELGTADATIHAQIGDIYRLRGERARALEHYARAIELGSADRDVLFRAVRIARDPDFAGGLPDARASVLAWLEKLSEICPQYTEAHYLRGLTLAELGRRDEAIVALRRAVETDPGHLGALQRLAELLVEAGRDEAAERIIERALELELEPERRLALESLRGSEG